MEMTSVSDIVKGLAFFEGMDPEHLQQLAECASEESFVVGTHLFFEGDAADKFYFVLEGHVSLQMGAGSLGFYTLEDLGPGDMLGWSWLFEPYAWTLTARAQSPVRLLTFDARCLRGKCADSAELHYELVERVARVSAQRLYAARLALLEQIV